MESFVFIRLSLDLHEEQRFRPLFCIVHIGSTAIIIIHAEGVALGQIDRLHHDARHRHDSLTGKSLTG